MSIYIVASKATKKQPTHWELSSPACAFAQDSCGTAQPGTAVCFLEVKTQRKVTVPRQKALGNVH